MNGAKHVGVMKIDRNTHPSGRMTGVKIWLVMILFTVCLKGDHTMITKTIGRAARSASGSLRTSGTTISVFGLWCPHLPLAVDALFSESLINYAAGAASDLWGVWGLPSIEFALARSTKIFR